MTRGQCVWKNIAQGQSATDVMNKLNEGSQVAYSHCTDSFPTPLHIPHSSLGFCVSAVDFTSVWVKTHCSAIIVLTALSHHKCYLHFLIYVTENARPSQVLNEDRMSSCWKPAEFHGIQIECNYYVIVMFIIVFPIQEFEKTVKISERCNSEFRIKIKSATHHNMLENYYCTLGPYIKYLYVHLFWQCLQQFLIGILEYLHFNMNAIFVAQRALPLYRKLVHYSN